MIALVPGNRVSSCIHAVIGVIERDDKILVSQRLPHQSYPGYWEFPGGKIEPHESMLNALKRELDEELGIHVIAATHCFQHEHVYPEYKVILEVYRVTHFLNEPISKEGQILRWLTLEEIVPLNLLEASRDIIKNKRFP